ncbi:MAG TPA: hypothetical protein VFQ68_39315 [Streptosporangiaceae bacterium]|nr:hypothetical protein [Streptosporangiaceae bacterium]
MTDQNPGSAKYWVRPLMEGIRSDALGPAGYALDRVVLPADG